VQSLAGKGLLIAGARKRGHLGKKKKSTRSPGSRSVRNSGGGKEDPLSKKSGGARKGRKKIEKREEAGIYWT